MFNDDISFNLAIVIAIMVTPIKKWCAGRWKWCGGRKQRRLCCCSQAAIIAIYNASVKIWIIFVAVIITIFDTYLSNSWCCCCCHCSRHTTRIAIDFTIGSSMIVINGVTVVVAYIVTSICNSCERSRHRNCRCSESCGCSSSCWIAISIAWK